MTILRASVLLSMFLVAACSSDSTAGPTDPGFDAGPGELAKSSLARDTSPDVSAAGIEQLGQDQTDFAWSFYQEAIQPGENLFFSPYSLSVALAMTYAGARGDTKTQIADALRFTSGQRDLHLTLNALDLELMRRAEAGGEEAPLPFRLEVTNALFGQVGFDIADPYLDTLALQYGVGLRLMDFVTEAEPSRLAINDWVADQTEDRIPELIPPRVITMDTRLVLVNAIYFTASWAEPFDEANTEDQPFRRVDGSEGPVPTMKQFIETSYVDGDGFEAGLLPYDGGALAMLVIVPDEGQFERIEAGLSGARVREIVASLGFFQVELAFPKFSFRSQVPAKAPLQSLGMVDAFMPGGVADFSGITDAAQLFIQDVVHEAFVAVDERGTEAAAATAVVFRVESAPPRATLTVDRPFIFAIVDRPTGATLFAGRVLDPT